MVELLLKKGASVGVGDEKERQPIHWAANLGECHIHVVIDLCVCVCVGVGVFVCLCV